VRRLPEDGAPPPAPRQNTGSAPAHSVPHPPPHESTVTGRAQNENGSRLVGGYQGCILTLLLAKTMKKIPSKNDRHDVANLIMC
jgi:hypothetical protein